MDTPTGIQRGLIGWFDVLGYKSIIENNRINEAVLVVKTIQEKIEAAVKRLRANEKIVGQTLCDYFLFSDTILICSPDPGHAGAAFFAEFSADLVSSLFWAGLPVRGAWSFGNFYIDAKQASITLAGLPIIEACKFADALDLAACVVAPSAEAVLTEKRILEGDRPLGFIKQRIPMKGLPNQEMFMLNHYAIDRHNNPERIISRQVVMEQFGAHNKQIGVEVLSKVNNTIEFLMKSKPS